MDDLKFLEQAADLAFLCPPTDKAFAVGCVIVARDGAVIATGYSREWGDGWHAEEVAIEKARGAGMSLKGCTLYSSLEPCSVRLSGKKPCCAHIAEAGIVRVAFVMREPPVFVEGRGQETLENTGISTVCTKNAALEKKVAAANAGVYNGSCN